ncbi:FkbM family methyltransferase [Mesorhizobium sp.]|uniref:FkbM family methyltransferase n=1 Tax=Mesorhizobium sp. TaxID=1871066 RepID=UPI000FEA10D1|nr:FkbM family methyltransferase [Mesorhizobium sp.]RWO92490.1 MAG: hypothetical protein EOQ95_04935 [Mesorhizobium sp.]RWQ58622.1 MAG: hypothetical protein EOS84_03665 [Mesorhizobium sp.]
MDRDLVYDVGMHNGDDTAFYMSQGYRVVAIEADPAQAEAGRKRFAAEIEKGQVHVVEAAIGPSHGQASFWISSNPELNSFDRQNAEVCNNTSHEIKVTCRPMNDIFKTIAKSCSTYAGSPCTRECCKETFCVRISIFGMLPVIDTTLLLSLIKMEIVSGSFGGYFIRIPSGAIPC